MVIAIIHFNTIKFYLLSTIIVLVVMVLTIIMVEKVAQYSEFQFIISFNRVTGFLKKSASRNTRFAAKTHLAVGEISLVAKKKAVPKVK